MFHHYVKVFYSSIFSFWMASECMLCIHLCLAAVIAFLGHDEPNFVLLFWWWLEYLSFRTFTFHSLSIVYSLCSTISVLVCVSVAFASCSTMKVFVYISYCILYKNYLTILPRHSYFYWGHLISSWFLIF